MNSTSDQTKAAVTAVLAISEAIRELGEIANGALYAQVCGRISLASYQSIIGTLVHAKLVRNTANMLTWIGPMKGVRA